MVACEIVVNGRTSDGHVMDGRTVGRTTRTHNASCRLLLASEAWKNWQKLQHIASLNSGVGV